MKFRIYYDDTDAEGIVYHANYLKFCERARSEHIFNTLGPDAFSKESYFVVVGIEAKFKGSAKLADCIEVRSKSVAITDISVVLKQEILLENKVIFVAQVKLVYLQNSKLSKIPQHFKKIFEEL